MIPYTNQSIADDEDIAHFDQSRLAASPLIDPIQASNAVTAKWLAMSWWDSRPAIRTTQVASETSDVDIEVRVLK